MSSQISFKFFVSKNIFLKAFLIFISIFVVNACAFHKKLYEKDLDFIYITIIENHPGIYNHLDPDFPKKLDLFYAEALSKLNRSREDTEAKSVISEFVKQFDDAHLYIHWDQQKQKTQVQENVNFSIAEFSEIINWAKLPTFDIEPNQEESFKIFLNQVSKLDKEDYLIFDIRGNMGGNSRYGSQVIDTIFGQNYANKMRCLYDRDIYVDWRVSEGNLNHIRALIKKFPNLSFLETIEEGMSNALKDKKYFYREENLKKCPSNAPTNLGANMKFIVITQSNNVSAALDFIDELKMMSQNVTLMGQQTKADRLYMKVRTLKLPSMNGEITFPIKLYRNRKRQDNQPYIPDIMIKNIEDDELLEKMIDDFLLIKKRRVQKQVQQHVA